MDGLQMMATRRSIRDYTERPVEAEKVEELLRAAMAAPTAGNQQSWRFVVVTKQETREALSSVTPYGGMLPGAPLAIVVCGSTSGLKHEGYWVQDCAAATEHLLLAAHALGLGAVWLGFYPTEDRWRGAARILGTPEDVVPFSVVSIGYPAGEKPPGERYDPEKVHWERW